MFVCAHLLHLKALKTTQLAMFLTQESVSKSFRTGRLEQELQGVQLSATRCSCNR